MPQQIQSIVLIGFKGCGKTTIGQLLAESLDCSFVDLDSVIEDLHEAHTGRRLSFREVFRDVGAEAFRETERQAADRVATDTRDVVLATGGGAVMDPATRDRLRKVGRVVYLNTSIDEMVRRTREGGFPAYLKSDDPESELRALFEERDPVYRECADVIVDLGDLDPETARDAIVSALG